MLSPNEQDEYRGLRVRLADHLRECRPEIQREALNRICSIGDPANVPDPEYAEGLRTSVNEALDYAIEAIGSGRVDLPIPVSLYGQARLAARNGIALDTVIRRYLAGNGVIAERLQSRQFVARNKTSASMERAIRHLAVLLDRLVEAVSDEYRREAENRTRSKSGRRSERIEKLLAGMPLDAQDLEYDLESWHVGMIAVGAGAELGVRRLAKARDMRLLQISRNHETAWAWLGGRSSPSAVDLQRLAVEQLPADVCLALGEPAKGLDGWRLSHRQAAAALRVALRRGDRILRYAEVPLLASILQDDVLAASLRQLYLAPLENDRDGGLTARTLLRTYFERDRNVTSTALALGMSRQTITARLQAIEERLQCPLHRCGAELEMALDLTLIETLPEQAQNRKSPVATVT